MANVQEELTAKIIELEGLYKAAFASFELHDKRVQRGLSINGKPVAALGDKELLDVLLDANTKLLVFDRAKDNCSCPALDHLFDEKRQEIETLIGSVSCLLVARQRALYCKELIQKITTARSLMTQEAKIAEFLSSLG
jgi:hypothetical protein